MPEPVVHPLFDLVNAGLAVTASAAVLVAIVAGMAFVRNLWAS